MLNEEIKNLAKNSIFIFESARKKKKTCSFINLLINFQLIQNLNNALLEN